MMKLKFFERFFYLYIISCVGICTAIAFMPFASRQKEQEYFLPIILVGVVFWAFLFIAILNLALLNYGRKKIAEKGISNNRRRMGVLCFFSSPLATFFDILMVLSLFIMIFALNSNFLHQQIVFIIISLFIFFVCMHGLLNGKNYNFLISIRSGEKNAK